MSAVDNLIRVPVPGVAPQLPWISANVERGPAFTRAFLRRRSLLLNPIAQASCEIPLRLPDEGSPSVDVTVKFTLACPRDMEAAVASAIAEAIYDSTLTPAQKINRLVLQAAQEYLQIYPGRDRFLSEFDSRHRLGFAEYLGPRLRALTRLRVDGVEIIALAPSATLRFDFDARMLDLADGRAVALPIALNLDVDSGNTPAMQAAYQRIQREQALQAMAPEWLDAYFRNVKLIDLMEHPAEVQANLRADLTVRAAPWGRIVGRLVLGRPQFRALAVSEDFQCWLADHTNLRLLVSGTLWVNSATPADGVTGDPWTDLASIIKARAGEALATLTYTQFDARRHELRDGLTRTALDYANRKGMALSLQIRDEWSHAWLLPGMAISQEVACAVRNSSSEARVKVSGKVTVDSSGPAIWQQMTAAQTEEALHRLIEETVIEHVGRTELEQYLQFETVAQSISAALRAEARSRFGLAIDDPLQIHRRDDWARKSREEFLKAAPIFEVAHPRSPSLRFQVQYRFLDTAVISGTPFAVFPIEIDHLTEGVSGCIRNFLGELPPRELYGMAAQRRLRELIEEEIPKMVVKKYFLKIMILLWIALPTPEQERLEARLAAHLTYLGSGQGDSYQRQTWMNELKRLAPLLEVQGGNVPWLELEAYGVKPAGLLTEAEGKLAGKDTEQRHSSDPQPLEAAQDETGNLNSRAAAGRGET